jgi:ABC-type uncharacterized transport system substrate-binding protein
MQIRIAVVPFISFVMLLSIAVLPSRLFAAEVLVVADSQLKPAMEIISGIKKSLGRSLKIVSPDEAKRGLKGVVEREGARVVVALGKDALAEALTLPPHIPVIFDMVVTPPVISRANTTGFYLATPVREYTDLIKKHLRSIRQVAVVGSRDQLTLLGRGEGASYAVRDTSEFVSTMRRLDDIDAVLLLPDTAVLTTTALDEAYLSSFRKGIPLLGVSERNVREGALVALVVDMVNVGRLIGDAAARALKGADLGLVPPSPPKKFDIYLNTATARRMKIDIPEEMVRMAKRVYP